MFKRKIFEMLDKCIKSKKFEWFNKFVITYMNFAVLLVILLFISLCLFFSVTSTRWRYLCSTLSSLGGLFLIMCILTIQLPFFASKYKTKDSIYYQNKYLSTFDNIFANPYIYIILFLFIFLLVVIALGSQLGTVGEWASAIASTSAVLLSLYKTFHTNFPNLIVTSKINSCKNKKYIPIVITIQNIDERIINLKCVKTEGIYFCEPKEGNWENNCEIDDKQIYSKINDNKINDNDRKKIINSVLLLDSINYHKTHNKSGSIQLFIDTNSTVFRIIFEDLQSKKEVVISARKIQNWKAIY